jgi:two-component system response regulator CpxR
MPPRVLYVDDHEDTCTLIRLVLTQSGYEVAVAGRASEALAQARSEEFEIYILDNRLPDSSGVELLVGLREFDPHTPAIFYSGDGFDAHRRSAMAAGAQAYLLKPCEPGELLATVSRLIGEANESVPPRPPRVA